MTIAFNFNANGTVPLTASTVSVNIKFTNPQSIAADSCMVYNAGSQIGFVGFGNSKYVVPTASVPSTTEVLNGTPIAAGAIMVLTKGNGDDTVCAITSTATTQMYFTAGQGN